ncbi:MAG TPA: hypothetical protein VHD56_05640 [Tepidisphaeraceae bacterium]|nr:hypothetical protein [Tepidisphaeraceae bacterium]
MTRERPILFSTEMVRAVLDGRKTQTRRVVKPQPQVIGRNHEDRPVAICDGQPITCRFGLPGDRLWVRERWGYRKDFSPDSLFNANCQFAYSADGSSNHLQGKWRQSRSMPRIASRIILGITDIRIQRLHSIDEPAARAEGFDPSSSDGKPLAWFRQLWDSLSVDGQFTWDSNPWLWVIDFKMLKVKHS